MAKMNLQARIDRLFLAPFMRDMPAFFDKTYDYIWLMETATEPITDGTEDARRTRFEAQYGTREEFIETRMKIWNKRYPVRGGEE